MSRFFTEVEFELPEDPGAPTKKVTKASFNKEKLTTAIAEIRAEFDRIAEGSSKLTAYPINPGGFGFPAQNRLKMFETDPTEENYKAFLELTKQDLGQRVAIYCMGLLIEAQDKKETEGGSNG
jgi:hypothetical protein